MKVTTLHQPYATLIAQGFKTIETRSQKTNIRGRIAIHAAAKRPADYWCSTQRDPVYPPALEPLYDLGRCVDPQESNDGEWYRYRWSGPLGAIVATANLVDCIPMVHCGAEGAIRTLDVDDNGSLWVVEGYDDEAEEEGFEPDWVEVTDQRPYGDFAPGRWAWMLEAVEPLAKPIPFKGGQGWSRSWDAS